MKKIIYGVQGEGLGHSARAFSIIEKLKKEYEIHIFTSKDALAFFKKMDYPYLHEVPSVDFVYSKNGSVNYFLSFFKMIAFIKKYISRSKLIKSKIKEINPTLAITDFEPIIPRLTNTCLSIDNQHKFVNCNLKLPIKLKIYSYLMKCFIRRFIPKVNDVIISTFHHDKEKTKAKITNVFIRDSFSKLKISNDEFILVYYKTALDNVIKILEGLNYNVKVYGKYGDYFKKGNVEYHPLNYDKFSKDLASCKVVFGCAGNQLIGEARYFGKPIFVIPIPNQYEQYINAFYVKQMGIGTSVYLDQLNKETVTNFIENFDSYEPHTIDGTQYAIQVIRSYMQ